MYAFWGRTDGQTGRRTDERTRGQDDQQDTANLKASAADEKVSRTSKASRNSQVCACVYVCVVWG
jgi:hypothetical protein